MDGNHYIIHSGKRKYTITIIYQYAISRITRDCAKINLTRKYENYFGSFLVAQNNFSFCLFYWRHPEETLALKFSWCEKVYSKARQKKRKRN